MFSKTATSDKSQELLTLKKRSRRQKRERQRDVYAQKLDSPRVLGIQRWWK